MALAMESTRRAVGDGRGIREAIIGRVARGAPVKAAGMLVAHDVEEMFSRFHAVKKEIAAHADITVSPHLAAVYVRNRTRHWDLGR